MKKHQKKKKDKKKQTRIEDLKIEMGNLKTVIPVVMGILGMIKKYTENPPLFKIQKIIIMSSVHVFRKKSPSLIL